MKLYVLNQLFHYQKKRKLKKKDDCEGSGTSVSIYMYAILPCVKIVSRLPVNHPKISSARPAWWPAPKYASVGGCSPLCPVWGAQGTTQGSSGTPGRVYAV